MGIAVPTMANMTSFTPAAKMETVSLPPPTMRSKNERMLTAVHATVALMAPSLSQVLPTKGLRKISESEAAETIRLPTMGLKPTSLA